MERQSLLANAMASHCRDLLLQWHKIELGLPKSLQPKHLMWMCQQIEQHSEEWPLTKLHRWLGFIQGGMLANQMFDLAEAKVMFDQAKVAFGESNEDLLDHLDSASSFEFDIGGEG